MINGKHYFVKIALLGLVLLVSCPFWASNVKSQQDDELVLMPAISLLLNSTNVIALGPGGELMFPEGSLPTGTKVIVQGAIPPILTDDLITVGSAFRVTVDKQPTLPVKVTLPVPSSENPDKLVLIRLESHGRITLLQTEVENGKLVAWTPGFSILAVARMVEKLKDGYKPRISGPGILPINTKGQYAETQFAEYIAGTRQWKAWSYLGGTVTLTFPGNPTKSNRVFLSTPELGYVYLSVVFTEPVSGLRASVTKSIKIVEELKGLDLDVYGPSIVKHGESFDLKTVSLNTEPIDISEWVWTLSGHGAGQCISGSDCSMPIEANGLKLYHSSSTSDWVKKETFTITVTSSSGEKVTASHEITVLPTNFRVIGFSRSPADDVLAWNESSPVIPMTFEAQLQGGQAPFDYIWSLSNGNYALHNDNYNDVDQFSTTINQPGDYTIKVVPLDDGPKQGKAYIEHFSVLGADLGEFFILSDLSSDSSGSSIYAKDISASNATVNQPVQATLQASGGVMYLASGYCPDYLYWIDWGDGSGAVYGQITSTDPVAGGSIDLIHTYTTAGIYTVKYYAIPKGCQSTPFDSLVEQNYDDLPIKTASITVDEAPPSEGTCDTDPQTVSYAGHIWQRCIESGTYDWEEAKTYCQDLALGGYSDWRLPTKDELKSLVVCSNGHPVPLDDWMTCDADGYGSYDSPTINSLIFLNGNEFGEWGDHWSSSEYEYSTNYPAAWVVQFNSGRATYGYQATSRNGPRCVR